MKYIFIAILIYLIGSSVLKRRFPTSPYSSVVGYPPLSPPGSHVQQWPMSSTQISQYLPRSPFRPSNPETGRKLPLRASKMARVIDFQLAENHDPREFSELFADLARRGASFRGHAGKKDCWELVVSEDNEPSIFYQALIKCPAVSKVESLIRRRPIQKFQHQE